MKYRLGIGLLALGNLWGMAEALNRDRAVLSEELIPPSGAAYNHASTLAEAGDGTLIAAWFGGSDEGADDVSIWLSRYEGKAWSAASVIDDGRREDGKRYACWNPVLVTDASGTVYLYYKISSKPAAVTEKGYENWWGCVKTSADRGRTWSARAWLPSHPDPLLKNFGKRLIGPVKNKPLILPDGTLLSGSSTESDQWRVHVEIGKPGAWIREVSMVGPLAGGEAIQPAFLALAQDFGKLQMICRPRTGKTPYASFSYDLGRSWSALEPLTGIQTTAGLDALTAGGAHFLAHNPAGARYPLMLARSRDGKAWEDVLPMLDQDGVKRMDYPALIRTKNGRIHVAHSWDRSHIKHLTLDADYLSDGGVAIRRNARPSVRDAGQGADASGRRLRHPTGPSDHRGRRFPVTE